MCTRRRSWRRRGRRRWGVRRRASRRAPMGPSRRAAAAAAAAAWWRAGGSRELDAGVPGLQSAVAERGGERAAAGGGALRGVRHAAVVVERARDAERALDDDGDSGGDADGG